MTREEAIKLFRRDIECLSHDKCSDCILEEACDPMKTPPDSEYIEAYGIAIEALSAEPCEDAISRQAVLDMVEDMTDQFGNKHRVVTEGMISLLPPVTPQPKTGRWIPVSERLPETDNENNINNFNVLLWVRNKTHPEREPQIYLGKLRHVDGDDGSGNFWGIETKPCEWTILGWSYFNEPEVIAWMPLPEPYLSENPTGSESEDTE